jgi:hypothetical protein
MAVALGHPPTAAGKEVALEVGFKCYLGDKNQLWLQALPACLKI